MATATGLSPSPAINLSSNDATVLQALFDAESSASSSTLAKIDSFLPSFPSISDHNSTIRSIKQRELAIIRRIQNATDNEKLSVVDEAITELGGLISEAPDYPPLYANRAQALRMHIQASSAAAAAATNSESDNSNTEDNAIFSVTYADIATRLWSDLTQAITLSTPAQQTSSVSPAQARLLSNAHTHRGYILLKAAKIRKDQNPEDTKIGGGGPQQLRNIGTRDELEEMASRDFFQAGRYGNDVAREVSVQTNPYAKLCGTIVKEALRKEMEEFQ
ncbi:uncharacterized protein TRUGW13939_05730 [Talaromyces rugulosus]|uniref:Uncharacterized protein n=1 Tax=Talaromyces rugulosus TaxID=121627 RepID=A0A7H8QYR8_TALRU|nr:uncharacterized protein TRUGW13939_05730 [Talaromyces rugulosus]QKX58605.1 hypothetical protein TRUGW13939_05730 [Talaromyces rugulosus]